MPVTTPEPSATARRAALQTERDTLAAHLESVRAKRDALTPSHPEWRRLSAELRSVEAELGDYSAAIAALGDEVQAQMRETAHAHRVERHRAAMQAAEQADAIPHAIDKALSEIVRLVSGYLAWAPNAAAAGGVDPNPVRLNDLVPTREAVAEIIMARLVAGGVFDRDQMPQRYEDDPIFQDELRRAGLAWPGHQIRPAIELAAEGSVLRDVHMPFRRTLATADPERQRREQDYLAEIARQRAAHEAEEAQKPRVIGPQPAPLVRTVAPLA